MSRIALAGLLLVFGGPAMAQAPSPVHTACEKYLTPAFARPTETARRGYAVDCSCVSGFLVGRYGTADAQVIVRVLAAASTGSDQVMDAMAKEIGIDRIRAVVARIGKFQDMGRDLNNTCPEARKP